MAILPIPRTARFLAGGRPADSAWNRDLRIDLARGIALLIIFIDHIDGNPAASWTLRRFGIIDAFDVFVFLSGYSLGLIYSREMNRGGYDVCMTKALRRCKSLYVAHIIAAAALIGLLLPFARSGLRIDFPEFYTFLHQPVLAAVELLAMLHVPHLLAILPLYILLTLTVPPALIGFSRRPWLVFAASFALYAAVQFFPALNFRSFPENQAWPWSVFAWQFPFLLSVFVGRAKTLGTRWRWLDSSWAFLASLASLALIFVSRHPAKVGALFHSSGGQWLAGQLAVSLPMTDKVTDHPLRLLNLAVFVIAARAVMNWARFHHSNLLRPLVFCGQHSLVIFIAGAFLSDFFTLMGKMGWHGEVYWLFVNSVGIAALLFIAGLMARFAQRSHPAPQP